MKEYRKKLYKDINKLNYNYDISSNYMNPIKDKLNKIKEDYKQSTLFEYMN